jgi:hypothetical protein
MAIPVVRKNMGTAKPASEEETATKEANYATAVPSGSGGGRAYTRNSLLANEKNVPVPAEAPMEDKHELPARVDLDPLGFLASNWLLPDDRSLTTDFLYFLLYLTQPCKNKHRKSSTGDTTSCNKKGRDSSISNAEEEHAENPLYGLECRWCAYKQGPLQAGSKRTLLDGTLKNSFNSKYKSSCGGRHYPVNSKTFGDLIVSNVQQHMLEDCHHCPPAVRASLKFLLHRHSIQTTRQKVMKGGKKKAFFEAMWERLQNHGSPQASVLSQKGTVVSRALLTGKFTRGVSTDPPEPPKLSSTGDSEDMVLPPLPFEQSDTAALATKAGSPEPKNTAEEMMDLSSLVLAELISEDDQEGTSGSGSSRKKKRRRSSATLPPLPGAASKLEKKKMTKSKGKHGLKKKKKKRKVRHLLLSTPSGEEEAMPSTLSNGHHLDIEEAPPLFMPSSSVAGGDLNGTSIENGSISEIMGLPKISGVDEDTEKNGQDGEDGSPEECVAV